MKRSKFFNKTILSLIAINMSIFLFAGCQNNSSSTTQAAGNSTQSNRKNVNKLSPEQMKQRVQDSIKPLVTAGTITQAQADKIVEAYSTRTSSSGQNTTQNNQQNNQQSNQQGNSQNNAQNRQRNNPLSKLVSDGVITQAQADAVMQKMRGNFTQKNNGQNSQNNNSQSSN
ncbi:MAG: hypothetical protein K0R54_1067 [Clostridiaceae bacterium]|jgi:polyhydroxyalkanoate synthesis regulator phasin|nr:hypothetical protein [Clostridiaceae bacterium]